MNPSKQAWVALILSLWPFLLFTFLSGITVLFLLTVPVAFNAERFRVEVLEPFVILVFQTVRSPAMAAPVLSALFGLAMGFGIMGWRVKEKAAMWAASFGVASLVMYALLLSLWSGFGR